jgi:predicted secreted hydrolase
MRKGNVRGGALSSLLSRRSVFSRAARMICVAGFPLQSKALATPAKAGNYPQVRPRALQFPRDFGAHADFRTEWWYITGWLGEGAAAMGFQLTFFRSKTRHPEENPSRFAPKQLLFAHAALAIVGRGELLHADRAARAGIAGVSFSENDTGLQMNDWGLQRAVQSGREIYIANMNTNAFSLAFEAQALTPPVLRGEGGYSQKGPLPELASFYYSRPQLQVNARVGHSGSVQQLSGRAWLDHEWSSSLLMSGASGWDWIGINLFDGGSLMAFRIRDSQGQTLWRHVDWRDAKGNVRHRSYRDGDWRAVQRWRSPRSLIEYVVRFTLAIQGREYEIVPVMNDQEVDARASTGGFYWEGAVTVLDRGKIIGRGYLELTGYGEALAL